MSLAYAARAPAVSWSSSRLPLVATAAALAYWPRSIAISLSAGAARARTAGLDPVIADGGPGGTVTGALGGAAAGATGAGDGAEPSSGSIATCHAPGFGAWLGDH